MRCAWCGLAILMGSRLCQHFVPPNALRLTRLKHAHPHFQSARRMQNTLHHPIPDASHQRSPNITPDLNQDRHDKPDRMYFDQPHSSHQGAHVTIVPRDHCTHGYVYDE